MKWIDHGIPAEDDGRMSINIAVAGKHLLSVC